MWSIRGNAICRIKSIQQSIRFYSSKSNNYKLTCGLEIHAQLNTKHKLFSDSITSFHAEPNSKVSYYDAAVPGTQPVFNWEAMLLALKAAVSLNCNILPTFSFDRKHYFYGDQPAGYQITQHYEPYASNGLLQLYERDGMKEQVDVRIKQIQIEQDTGKSTYIDDESMIDLNRTNTGLIELVTEPDIKTPEAAGIFVKKLQMLLRHLGVCTGELETGAMRVDVNVSVNGGQRCEIKNLSSTSAIVHAIKAEFKRQVRDIENGIAIESETRGWDGNKTWKLRGKEEGVDYRYMPDPELQPICVSNDTLEKVVSVLPKLPDTIFKELLEAPYNVPLKDARTLMQVPQLVDYYRNVYDYLVHYKSNKPQAASNWIVHRYYGELNTQEQEFDPNLLPVEQMGQIILLVEQDKMTISSAVLLLRHLIANPLTTTASQSINSVIEELDLSKVNEDSEGQEAIEQLCLQIIQQHSEIAEQVRSGKKPNSIMFLVGQVMKECQGRINAQNARAKLYDLITQPRT